uniref:Uncharacterized protein n=1 Tax=Brassica campestris TaxID=3711 RepID=M4DN68_BRACM
MAMRCCITEAPSIFNLVAAETTSLSVIKRKKLTPMIQSFGCLSQVLVQSQSQSRRVMKKTAKNKEDVNRDWTKSDHYGSATMIMRLKATIQSLEEQMSSVTEKSAKYAQIAAQEVPKSNYCLGVPLTTE